MPNCLRCTQLQKIVKEQEKVIETLLPMAEANFSMPGVLYSTQKKIFEQIKEEQNKNERNAD